MATSVTSTELAKRLSDILNRTYYQGEAFIVERNGQAVAMLAPIPRAATPRTTWREIVQTLGDLAWPDPAFSDDLEAVQATQPPLETPVWDS